MQQGYHSTRTVALLGKLSDAGIDASSSATSLRNIFIESASQGLNYEEILVKIGDSQDQLTASNDQFGKRAAVSSSILSNLVDEVGDFDEALQNAGGTAERVANQQLDTLDGQIKLLTSAWDGFILSIESGDGSLANFAKGAIQFTTDFINGLSNIDLLISVLGKDLDELSDKELNKLLDLGLETDSGKEVKDFFDALKNQPFDKIVANVDSFRESFAKALHSEGENIDESRTIFNAWFNQRKIAFDAQKTFDAAIKAGLTTQEQFNQKWAASIAFLSDGDEKIKIINGLYQDYADVVKEATEEQEEFNRGLSNIDSISAITEVNKVKDAYQALKDFLIELNDEDSDNLKSSLDKNEQLVSDALKRRVKLEKESSIEKLKIQEEEDFKRAAIRDTAFQSADIIGNTLFDNNRIRSENQLKAFENEKNFELELAGDNAQQRSQIEADFARKEKEIRKKQAKDAKKQAIFNVTLSTAQAVVNALATLPFPAAAVAAVAAGVVGAVQTAAIISQPLPAFEDGGLVKTDGQIITSEKGSEMFIDKRGKIGFTGDKGAEVRTGMKGSTIIPADITKDIVNKGFDHNQINQESSMKITQVLMEQRDRQTQMLAKTLAKETDILAESFDRSLKKMPHDIFNVSDGDLKRVSVKGATRHRNWMNKVKG